MLSSILGFPRIGKNRELKFAVEKYWKQELSESQFLEKCKEIRREHFEVVSTDIVPCNDFSMYDQVLDHMILFGMIPAQYQKLQGLELYFAMARGLQSGNVDVPAMEMKKWFDTNYHYIVPRVSRQSQFKLNPAKILSEFLECRDLNKSARPVIIGPITMMLLSRNEDDSDKYQLVDQLVPLYKQLFQLLKDNGCTMVQCDEPALVMDLPQSALDKFQCYSELNAILPVTLTSYFGSIANRVELLNNLSIDKLHVDMTKNEWSILTKLNHPVVLGVVNGRNIWKSNLNEFLTNINQYSNIVEVSTSCSLLHVPYSLEGDHEMPCLNLMAFATEKLQELSQLKDAVNNKNGTQFESVKPDASRVDQRVQLKLQQISPDMFCRQSPFPVRYKMQQDLLKLPLYPTTTVGSFPQTKEVRQKRLQFKKGQIDEAEYKSFLKSEIKKCVEIQEQIGLDVLVHGEFERTDMVEHFSNFMTGYTSSKNGWVQSYGSRCVKPPVLYGDISRKEPMTLEMTKYAQSLTNKPVKGMLTGPVTCLQWSFVRDDQTRESTAYQLALAILEEVQDLEKAGVKIIQIDEPAIREGLPLRQCDWDAYLKWSINAFLLATTGVKDSTQIHTHMCYSDFQDIFSAIKRMDADVLSIEFSRSDSKLLQVFKSSEYHSGIGPGVYDIHSPRVPTVKEMKLQLVNAKKYLDPKVIWTYPDCGLKTRGWEETIKALTNMVQVAKEMRQEEQTA